MKIRRQTPVYTANGVRVGVVDRLVIDPSSFQLTDLVVRRGFLLPEVRVVPLEAVATATRHRINLRNGVVPEELQRFEESFDVPVEPAVQSSFDQPTVWLGPHGATALPVLQRQFQHVTRRNIAEGLVAVDSDAEVVTSEGHRVGKLEELVVSSTGRMVCLVVPSGWFSKKRRAVPAGWIDRITEGRVHLGVDTSTTRGARDYEPAEHRLVG